LSAAPAV